MTTDFMLVHSTQMCVVLLIASHNVTVYFNLGAESLGILIYAVAAVAMAVPTFDFSFVSVFVSFLVLEAMVGMFYSCGGILRSKYYPEAHQSSIMTVFRLPLNALVVVGESQLFHSYNKLFVDCARPDVFHLNKSRFSIIETRRPKGPGLVPMGRLIKIITKSVSKFLYLRDH